MMTLNTKDHHRTQSGKGDLNASPIFEFMRQIPAETEALKSAAAGTASGKNSGKPYVSITFAHPAFGDKRVFANLARTSQALEDGNVLAILWNPQKLNSCGLQYEAPGVIPRGGLLNASINGEPFRKISFEINTDSVFCRWLICRECKAIDDLAPEIL